MSSFHKKIVKTSQQQQSRCSRENVRYLIGTYDLVKHIAGSISDWLFFDNLQSILVDCSAQRARTHHFRPPLRGHLARAYTLRGAPQQNCPHRRAPQSSVRPRPPAPRIRHHLVHRHHSLGNLRVERVVPADGSRLPVAHVPVRLHVNPLPVRHPLVALHHHPLCPVPMGHLCADIVRTGRSSLLPFREWRTTSSRCGR